MSRGRLARRLLFPLVRGRARPRYRRAARVGVAPTCGPRDRRWQAITPRKPARHWQSAMRCGVRGPRSTSSRAGRHDRPGTLRPPAANFASASARAGARLPRPHSSGHYSRPRWAMFARSRSIFSAAPASRQTSRHSPGRHGPGLSARLPLARRHGLPQPLAQAGSRKRPGPGTARHHVRYGPGRGQGGRGLPRRFLRSTRRGAKRGGG